MSTGNGRFLRDGYSSRDNDPAMFCAECSEEMCAEKMSGVMQPCAEWGVTWGNRKDNANNACGVLPWALPASLGEERKRKIEEMAQNTTMARGPLPVGGSQTDFGASDYRTSTKGRMSVTDRKAASEDKERWWSVSNVCGAIIDS
jgi:hypothetical protein